MSDYLLDTTAIIDYLRNKLSVPELLEKLCLEGGILCCCPINIVEVYAGMKDKEKASTDEFLASLKCFEITNAAGYTAGNLKRIYAGKGITLSTADVLIAAVAIQNSLTLVTGNAKHFPIENLRLLSY